MLTHDHNTVETEVKETEEKNPILETVLNDSEDKMSYQHFEDEKEDPQLQYRRNYK
jgi:hypothetical protein